MILSESILVMLTMGDILPFERKKFSLMYPVCALPNISGIFEHKKGLDYSEFLLDLQFATATIFAKKIFVKDKHHYCRKKRIQNILNS